MIPIPWLISQLPGGRLVLGPFPCGKAVKSFVLTAMDTQCDHRFSSSAHKASAQTALCSLTEHLVWFHGLPGSTVLMKECHTQEGSSVLPMEWLQPQCEVEMVWWVEGWQALQAQLLCQLGGGTSEVRPGSLEGYVHKAVHMAIYAWLSVSSVQSCFLAAMILGCGHHGWKWGRHQSPLLPVVHEKKSSFLSLQHSAPLASRS